jgi:DnaJ domain
MAFDPMTASLLPYSPERDVYRLLQVAPTADDREIAAACRRLALAFHPDYNRSPRAHEEMQVVNAVRNLLTDPRSRAVYDGARRRFLYVGERSRLSAVGVAARTFTPRHMGSRSIAADVVPFQRPRPVFQVLHERARRVGRALLAAVRNTLAELGPAHCPTCNETVQPSDRYCAWCGTWVGRTEKLRGT